MHKQEAIFLLPLGKKVPEKLQDSRDNNACYLSKPYHNRGRSPFPQTLAVNGRPGAREAAGVSWNWKSVYLESRGRLGTGENQRGDENHAGEVAGPLCGREDGDGAPLQ